MMSEQSIATVRASVMVYDDSTKKWIPSGSSGTQGVSKVQIFHHFSLNTFRVVGRKLQDHEVVINCAITRGLKYNQTTATFHQWRDQRQVYGLNFVSSDDAGTFANSMLRAIEVVTASVAPPGSNAAAPATPNTPTPRDSYQNGVPNVSTVGRTSYQQQQTIVDDSQEVCYSVSSISNVPPAHQQQHVRRSSQGSNSTSSSNSGSSVQNSQSNIIYSSVTPNVPGGPPTSSPSRPAPPAPPPPPAPSATKNSLGQKPAVTSSSAPPPPPLPPGGLSMLPAAKPVSLAEDIASMTGKLKKTVKSDETKESRSASVGSVDTNGARLGNASGQPLISGMISEMAATLARRRMIADGSGPGQSNGTSVSGPVSNGGDTESPTKNQEKDAKRPWESKNGRFEEKPVNDSPKTHRNCFRVPSGSSLSSQEEAPNIHHGNGLASAAAAARANGGGPSPACGQQVVVTQEYLDQFRQEILNEVRSEITKAKVEIIEGDESSIFS